MNFQGVTFQDGDFERVDEVNARFLLLVSYAAAVGENLADTRVILNKVASQLLIAELAPFCEHFVRGTSVPVAHVAKTIRILAEANEDKANAHLANKLYKRAKKVRRQLAKPAREVAKVLFTPTLSACFGALTYDQRAEAGFSKDPIEMINALDSISENRKPIPPEILVVATRSEGFLKDKLRQSLGKPKPAR